MISEKGSISINTENIMPIIKKWLYSDKDIFLRELISNANDAISKFKGLVSIGEANAEEGSEYKIKVLVNKKNKTLKVIDNGIGMTSEEVKKYINQVAFSGAEDFLKKYKDKMDKGNEIIGHFGLGFYSAFMVSSTVSIDTVSYKEGSEGVRWLSDGGTEFSMEPSDRAERGTTITLNINDDAEEFLEYTTVSQTVRKYCSFLPVEIYVEDENEEKKESKKDDEEEAKKPEPINDTHPLWLKNPAQCTEEEYKDFYKKVFFDFDDPLFWIHLNVDYPFRLKGILYFPKLKNEFERMEGQIKLYNNQVFIADNIKEVIPEFLMLLKGTIDCPDLPLNVSRSFLQNDGYVRKISQHITKKVGDKLKQLFKTEREDYNKYWDDINPFIKYGCMRDDKFYESVKDIVIFKNTADEYVTLTEYLESVKLRHENKVFYITDEKQQSQYINMFKENDLKAIYLNAVIDPHFVQFLEMKNNDVKLYRIDSDISDILKDEEEPEDRRQHANDIKSIEEIYKKNLGIEKLNIKVESLKSEDIPALYTISEQQRRMQDMSAQFGMMMGSMPPAEQTLVLNAKSPLNKKILELNKSEKSEDEIALLCKHVYDLALLSHKQFEPDQMTEFIKRSNKLLTILAEEKGA